MFPTNLQKSIRELDRQISLLETECENMESENIEFTVPLKADSKLIKKESSGKAFAAVPCLSSSSHTTKDPNFSHIPPKIYSASCSHFAKVPVQNTDNCLKKLSDGPKQSVTFHEGQTHAKKGHPLKQESMCLIPGEKKDSMPIKKSQTLCDTHNRMRSINSIREVAESSDDNFCHKKNSFTPIREQKWRSVDCKNAKERWKEGKDDSDDPSQTSKQLKLGKKPSSAKGSRRQSSTCSLTERPATGNASLDRESVSNTRHKIFTKRRSRSVRTKKNSSTDLRAGVDFSKSLEEKEIQCALFDQENEKTEFLEDVNSSIKTLQILVGELKEKSCKSVTESPTSRDAEERKKDVLNDMQNTLEKISSIKSIQAINNPLNNLACSKAIHLRLFENDQHVVDLKKILLGVKLYCQELSDEKQTMTLKLAAKNRTIEGLKNNEKEYLSLISSLKFNVEKLKEEAEEGSRAINELQIVKKKLMEETKVIEALKKSHGKMQDLIQNYVLENDKLRAQGKMAKLESQKFTVLLSGKEAEIYKYKKEIESFQKQITEQLSLLRSKASENQVAQTIEVIKKQSIFQPEVDSYPSETTLERGFNPNSPRDPKSSESLSIGSRNESKYRMKNQSAVPGMHIKTEIKSGRKSDQVRDAADDRDAGFTSCRSDDSEQSEEERKCRLRVKRPGEQNFWPLPQNSSNTSLSTSFLNTSENEKESRV